MVPSSPARQAPAGCPTTRNAASACAQDPRRIRPRWAPPLETSGNGDDLAGPVEREPRAVGATRQAALPRRRRRSSSPSTRIVQIYRARSAGTPGASCSATTPAGPPRQLPGRVPSASATQRLPRDESDPRRPSGLHAGAYPIARHGVPDVDAEQCEREGSEHVHASASAASAKVTGLDEGPEQQPPIVEAA